MLGLWLHESGALAASPDGLVTKAPGLKNVHFQTDDARFCTPNIIEVKCPYSFRDSHVAEAVNADKRGFLGMFECKYCFFVHSFSYK
jgi:hypothetical protein